MSDLRIRDFPDELQREAKSEASLDGDSLKALVIEAVRHEVARRRKRRADARQGQ